MKLLLTLLLTLGASPAFAQDCRLTAAQVAELTKVARASTKDDKAFLKSLDAAVKGTDRRLETGLVSVSVNVGADQIGIALLSPYARYRLMIESALRKMDPIERITLEPEFSIVVSPTRIDSLDIEKIVVQRDGVTIEPTSNQLKVEELTSRIGAKVALHAGEVRYPCTAFAPVGTVTITAIPRVGKNITKTLKPDDLAALK